MGGALRDTDGHNPLIGEHPSMSDLYFTTGFSGHGLMIAPGVGYAVSEFVLTGRPESIDIDPFDLIRFSRGQPFRNNAMI